MSVQDEAGVDFRANLIRYGGDMRDVAVLEKGWLGGGNTGRNTTIVRSNYHLDPNAHFYEFSLKLWETLSRELNFNVMLDDGTTSRLGTNHYLMTTTTVNAVRVLQHLEALLQVDWPELDVYVTSVTEHWAAAALSGPGSREVLARVVDVEVGNDAFPFLALRECLLQTAVGAIPARLFRISYSGELAYEVHVPANHGRAMWESLLAAGEASGIMLTTWIVPSA